MNHGQNTGGGENPNRATGNFKLNIDERDLATGNIDLPERRSQPPRPEYSVNKAYLTEKEPGKTAGFSPWCGCAWCCWSPLPWQAI